MDYEFKYGAFLWCQKYLGGTWSSSTFDQFIISQLEGGLTNYLYVCALEDSVQLLENEFRQVLLRIYGEIYGPTQKLVELLTFTTLSERKVGPRLLGAFLGGRIEEYFDTTPLSIKEFRDEKYYLIITRKLATYHNLDLPVSKKPKFYRKFVKTCIPYMEELMEPGVNELSKTEKSFMKEIEKLNLVKEYEWLCQYLEKVDSPVVFCHNDVQEGNVLKISDQEDHAEVRLIDFEYSSYNFRGYDLGNYFCEFVFQNHADNEAGFIYELDMYPNEEKQMQIISVYLAQIKKELENSAEHIKKKYIKTEREIIHEANMYSLMSHLLWGFWGVAQNKVSKIKWGFLDYSLARFKAYFYFKQKFGL